jgi:GntR family transcriptional regulator of gluconate operon
MKLEYPAAWLQGMSRGEAIASVLRLRIIDGTVEIGAVISENKVAADFGASRSPVREALRMLSNEGLLRLERMGAVVLGLSPQAIEELYDVRYLIESFAQRRLAGQRHASLHARLWPFIDKMEVAAKYGDAAEFSLLDFTFHETIIAATGHTRIWHLWSSIRQIVLTVMLITTAEVFSQGDERLRLVIYKHRTLIEGLESGDADRIGKAVEAYFADSIRTLRSSLRED